ncbi:MAG: Crp/Fnr family transcriptional regulator [Parvularculaceae bacterium]
MSEVKNRNVRVNGKSLPASCAYCPVSSTTEWACINAAADDVLKSARRLTAYQVGETIFHQNDESLGLHCLMSGLVILKQLDAFGTETAFRLLFPGQTCGWRSLFGGQAHRASGVVLESSRVCFIPRDALDRMLKLDPNLSRRFLRTLANDPGPADAVLLRNPFLPARIRLAHLLLILSERCLTEATEGAVCYRLPIKRKHIAALIGARGETVSRTIKELEDESLVSFDRRNVLIPDVDRLRAEIG